MFWSTIDGPTNQLKRLCGEKRKWDGTYQDLKQEIFSNGYNMIWENFDPKKLANVEVMVNDVLIQGTETIIASDLIKEQPK